jgi:hypothetical protein
MTFHEHDVVILAEDLPDHGLRKGDTGTIVHRHDRSHFEVEFGHLSDDSVAVVTLSATALRLWPASEMHSA